MTLRVGLISSEFPPDHGGVETYAWQLAKELGQRPNLAVTVYVPHRSAGIAAPPGVTLKPLLTSCMGLDWPRLRSEAIDVWHALSAAHAWLAEKNRPTVVSVHGNDFLAPYPLTARPALSLPILHTLRPLIWRRMRPTWLHATQRMLARALPRTTAILANSRYTEEVFLKRFPACRGLTSVGLVGVADEFFSVQHIPRTEEKPPRLMTLSRLSEERKNVDKVLRALAIHKNRYDFRYTIVGDGHMRPALEQLTQQLGLTDQVRFCGYLTHEDLKHEFASSDLFILTSSILADSHEGFGIVYLEANACGTPVLAARLAGSVEAVQEGVSGMFVDEPSVEKIAACLELFLSGEARFDSQACRAFAEQFGWDNVVERVLPAYKKAISSTDV